MNVMSLVLAAALLGQASAGGPPVPLFNGNDLSGWNDSLDNGSEWNVKDGVLEGRGGGPGKPAVLVCERPDATNFRLKVVYGCRSKPGFGAVEVRRSSPEDGVTRSYWVAAVAGPHWVAKERPCGNVGKFKDYRYGNGWPPARESPPVQAALNRWHTLEIVAQGDTITSFVNGKQADRFTDRKGAFKSGGVALVVGGADLMQFKEIAIQELPE